MVNMMSIRHGVTRKNQSIIEDRRRRNEKNYKKLVSLNLVSGRGGHIFHGIVRNNFRLVTSFLDQQTIIGTTDPLETNASMIQVSISKSILWIELCTG